MSGWWLWGYVAAMAAGALLFLRWWADPKGVPSVEYRVALAVPVWSGLWYTLLALGGGRTDGGGHPVYWARYADWAVSASLLLTALALTATHALPHRHPRLLTTLVGANLVMILSGLLGDLAVDPWSRYLLFGFGALSLLAILTLIYGPLRAVARRQPTELYRAYREAALLLGALWLGYPVFWLLGPSGVGLLGGTTDTALFVLLSVASKVGWGALDLARLRELGARHELPLGSTR
ncbi:bacteriorhodopsin [Micromonospora siamensis]|uniref:Bacteriorhodopsin n=1 Tax=Micromonospora siamensis TaxID=299152 RepID=A0A1C5K4S8_9ACTN|nr:bacteriorhodopsin [Micromonospora siamensis]SCG77742.1 bacteriorhodopsin [Micromonospora siamensis]